MAATHQGGLLNLTVTGLTTRVLMEGLTMLVSTTLGT